MWGMYHHYAMFTLRAGPDRAANARKLKAWLQRLGRDVTEIRSIRIEMNRVPGPSAADMLMTCTYASARDLAAVRADPRHRAMLAWYFTVAVDSERREVNFVDRRGQRPARLDTFQEGASGR